LYLRFRFFYGDPVGEAVWSAIFHSISAFNNAGFGLNADSLMAYVADPWILSLIMIGVFVGSLGFPVVLMIAMNWNRPKNWDLHTRLTLTTTTIVLALGFVFLLLFESGNPKTLGDKNAGHTLMEVLFMAVMPRSGGFSTMDVADMSQSTHLLM
ncbi:TrkH family potassium uptake protein, partial [Burkholderia multivorans]|uniref:potassium transporter TrkG n=1 Tax=Burkholderia multivorans TaxID=87883 RepID=UPI000DB8BD29